MRHYKQYPTTFFLLGLTALVFLAMQVLYPGQASTAQVVYQFGGMYGRAVLLDHSQLWRLITPIFVHIGWEHFILNGLTLYFVGQMVEQVWGSWKFLLLYVLSGIMGNAFTLLLTPDVVAAGASTSLFGLFAAIIVIGYFGANPYLKQLGQSYQILLVINLIFNLFSPSISLEGHVGGAIGGLLLAIFLPSLVDKSLFKKWQRYLALGLYLALFLLALVISLR